MLTAHASTPPIHNIQTAIRSINKTHFRFAEDWGICSELKCSYMCTSVSGSQSSFAFVNDAGTQSSDF